MGNAVVVAILARSWEALVLFNDAFVDSWIGGAESCHTEEDGHCGASHSPEVVTTAFRPVLGFVIVDGGGGFKCLRCSPAATEELAKVGHVERASTTMGVKLHARRILR
jgi:hypothetical protein